MSLRRGLLVAAGVVALAVAAGFVLFDPNAYKDRIVAAVKQATGRDVALNGRIGLKLSLSPSVRVAEAVVANPVGFSRPDTARIERLELSFALLPLLGGRLEIHRVLLVRPDILLETDSAGRANWLVDTGARGGKAGPPAPVPGAAGAPGRVSVAAVVIEDGRVAYRDGRTGRVTALEVAELEATSRGGDQALHLEARARFDGVPFTLAADTGGLAMLAGADPWPVKLALASAGATLTAEGALSGLGRLRLAVGFTNAAGTVSGDVDAAAGPRAAVTARFRSARLDFDGLAAPGVAEPGGAAPGGGQAAPGGVVQAAPAAGGRAVPAGQGRLFPDTVLPFAALRDLDADVGLEVGVLRAGGVEARDAGLHASVRGGVLEVDRLTAMLAGGAVTGSARIDASGAVPLVHFALSAPGVPLQAVLAAAGQPAFATGRAEAYADVRGKGATAHAIAGSLDGTAGVAVSDGTLDNRLGGGLLAQVVPQLGALAGVARGGSSDLRCLAARFDIRDGEARARALALGSSLLTMTGDGGVDLGAETVALVLRPQLRIGGARVALPVRIAGPLRRPGVATDQGAALDAGREALGLLGGLLRGEKRLDDRVADEDPCPAALAAARGQAVAPGAEMPGSILTDPGAALRSLLR